MRLTIRPDFDHWILGSVLRRARRWIWRQDLLRYDPDRPASLNDLVLVEVLPPSDAGKDDLNWLERMLPGSRGEEIVVRRERVAECTGVAVIGNRYAPPYVIGGLSDPVSRTLNGEIRGGSVVQSLFGLNCIGFVNHARQDFPRVSVRVRGVLVDRQERPVNLRDFRERIDPAVDQGDAEAFRILVAGFRTDAGKTVCARALVQGLIDRGFRVTAEKKSGTSCCRDWLSCFEKGEDALSAVPPAGVRFCPESHPGRDFVDGLGIASDVSVDPRIFAVEGSRFTDAFLRREKPEYHVVELADSIAHSSNQALLLERGFSSKLGALVYCPCPCMETAVHAVHFIRSRLGLADVPLILSGPLANEGQYAMYRSELRDRVSVPIVPCARQDGERWRSQGDELVDRILALPGLQPRRAAGGEGLSGSPECC